ncbi:hypothetical protein FC83_GL000042 [Agrilactobacillus composti DSM 18527 = JCM 14202]|uniref:Transmembrane protein n=1 Tax=Agrilactobacillus composti DSM 18527 = JCM 14202 TaxID=1423734 RepID=X0PTH3_9LACO|nr:hypothetical protein [Agrilactobacillus composti]KRM36143.1 hypothetical protein FC83_GL000042 [Agrilactobacillus composti DSM 18527 = JCM 14202]GAF41317.1 hypothetical protein JCM14202_3250 [Agrilactobacillus composti DSM 18527 = JCM 14202]
MAKLWRILPTELKIVLNSRGSYKPGTFAGIVALGYGSFLVSYWYTFVLNRQQIHGSDVQLFYIKVAFFAMFLFLSSEFIITCVAIDNEGTIMLHQQQIHNFIKTKILVKYLIAAILMFTETVVLIITYAIFNGGAQLLDFVICIVPLTCVLSVMTVFSTIVFPNFYWIDFSEMPTRKSYHLESTSSLFVVVAMVVAFLPQQYLRITVGLFFWVIALVLAYGLIKVSPVILAKKLYLNVPHKPKKGGRKHVTDQ